MGHASREGKTARGRYVSQNTHTKTTPTTATHHTTHVYNTITYERIETYVTRFVYRTITPARCAMPEREARTVRVDPDVWAVFREQIDEWDGENPGHVGYHVEQALKEYVDTDRYARVEDKLDKVLAHVSDGGGSHTHTNTAASGTVERAREVYQRVADNHGIIVREDDLVRAIEDIAGADDRTVEKYKGILKRRSLIFQHPADSLVWTTNRGKWVKWAESYVNNNPTIEVYDVIDDYEITTERFDELAEADQ